MKKTLWCWLLAGPSLAWAGLGLNRAFGDYTFDAKVRALHLVTLGLVLILVYFAACFFRKTRRLAAICLLILVGSGVATRSLRSHRLAAGIQQLEESYRDIAARGQPFPDAIDRDSYENPAFLHWYYQKHSERSFAIVYLVSSDGWAIEYPEGTWRYIGYQPDGYSPNVAADADR